MSMRLTADLAKTMAVRRQWYEIQRELYSAKLIFK
jgi:hypothetical protein